MTLHRMPSTLLADPTRVGSPNDAASCEADACSGAVVCLAPQFRVLDPFLYQEMRWCERRGELQPFVAMFECEFGRVELCLGCSEEHFVPFSRETEAA